MAGHNFTPSDFYVYLHRRATDGRVFYVGKGVSTRAWRKDKRNQHWKNIVKKHGYIVEIVQDGMQEVFQAQKTFGMANRNIQTQKKHLLRQSKNTDLMQLGK